MDGIDYSLCIVKNKEQEWESEDITWIQNENCFNNLLFAYQAVEVTRNMHTGTHSGTE
jgi:hypothetical protein